MPHQHLPPPPKQLLPEDDEELAALIREHGQIEVGRMFGVTQQAVSKAARKRGLDVPGRVNYFDTIPWVVASEHVDEMARRFLRFYAKKLSGRPLSAREERAVKIWTEFLEEDDLVVDYQPSDPAGPFVFVPRREGIDVNYVRTPDPGNPYARKQHAA